LALFRRRPQVRVDSFVIPASENLHNSGHPQSHIVRATLGRITEQVKVE
jgi:hypothetical protein